MKTPKLTYRVEQLNRTTGDWHSVTPYFPHAIALIKLIAHVRSFPRTTFRIVGVTV